MFIETGYEHDPPFFAPGSINISSLWDENPVRKILIKKQEVRTLYYRTAEVNPLTKEIKGFKVDSRSVTIALR